MTNPTTPDPTKAGELAQKIVAILINEDSVIRQRAFQAAMALLGEEQYRPVNGHANSKQDVQIIGNQGDLAAFFNREDDLKPADYVQLCAAFHYSLFGNMAFSLAELRAIASEAGVVLPDRPDMTLSTATKKGKKLFQSAGRGLFKPTAAARLSFMDRWNVRPGKKTKLPSSAMGEVTNNA